MKKQFYKYIKRYVAGFLAGCLCAVILSPVTLSANQVPEMKIDVALRSDGSACITQTWTADTDEGTEFYLACHDSGYLAITDFSVADDYGPYTFVEDWDVDASFEEKAHKCGILQTDEGVELCWGISEYGRHQYVIKYVLHDLVGSYSDADGFNHCFVDEMSFFPFDAVLTIRNQDGTPLTDDICDIWAFGFEGQIQFEDAVIRAWSQEALESGQHMTVMVALEKEVISPLRTVEESFETVKEEAFEGSDYYEEDLTAGDILMVIVLLVLLGVFIVLIAVICAKVRKAKLNKQMKSVDYFRDAPNNGNLNMTYQLGLGCELCKEDALLGAYLLRLISEGCLEPEAEHADSKNVRLQLVHPPQSGDKYDDILYTVLEAAAGADGVLQARELERYCALNRKPVATFMESCERDAKQALIRLGCLKGVSCDGLKSLTKQGKIQMDEILGLKRFLLDFSLIHERGIKESVIWQDYMIYAFLLGIADKVAPQIREMYPEALPQVEQFERCIVYTGYYNGVMYNAYARERQLREAARTSGSGGRASIGGGGGFSGGGGGGIR